jgi:hypothetical protein
LIPELTRIVDVKVVAPFVLRLTFNDGFAGEVDFSDLKNFHTDIVRPLHDPEFFAKVRIDGRALAWPNGYAACADAMRMQIDENYMRNIRTAE